MKKVFFFAAFLLFSMTAINAQDVKFGAKAGVNFASIMGDETEDVNTRTSLHFGVVSEIPISEKFSFQPELMYSAQGAKYEDSYTEDGFTVKEELTGKLDYLNIPLMAKFYVADGFSLEAGPQIGFLLSAKADYEFSASGGGEDYSESDSIDLKDETKSIDFGANFGVGYKMESGLNFGIRYNLGLSNINDGEGSDDFKNQNGVFQISVGYFF